MKGLIGNKVITITEFMDFQLLMSDRFLNIVPLHDRRYEGDLDANEGL